MQNIWEGEGPSLLGQQLLSCPVGLVTKNESDAATIQAERLPKQAWIRVTWPFYLVNPHLFPHSSHIALSP